MVKDMGVVVHLVHGGNLSASADMRMACDERIELDGDFVYDVRRGGNVRQPDNAGDRNADEFNY
jgi:hypothetical protein